MPICLLTSKEAGCGSGGWISATWPIVNRVLSIATTFVFLMTKHLYLPYSSQRALQRLYWALNRFLNSRHTAIFLHRVTITIIHIWMLNCFVTSIAKLTTHCIFPFSQRERSCWQATRCSGVYGPVQTHVYVLSCAATQQRPAPPLQSQHLDHGGVQRTVLHHRRVWRWR